VWQLQSSEHEARLVGGVGKVAVGRWMGGGFGISQLPISSACTLVVDCAPANRVSRLEIAARGCKGKRKSSGNRACEDQRCSHTTRRVTIATEVLRENRNPHIVRCATLPSILPDMFSLLAWNVSCHVAAAGKFIETLQTKFPPPRARMGHQLAT
jgi:hypothetical protein